MLMTKDLDKVERLYSDLPQTIKIVGKQVTHEYRVNWQREGTDDFQGSRFIFKIDEVCLESPSE